MTSKKNTKVEFVKKINDENGRLKYVCRCNDCGKEVEMWPSHFYRGSSSCKCKNYKKNYPRLYGIWTNMKTRCYNDNVKSYEYYGAKGISVCDEWNNSFAEFMKWSFKNGYSDELTIDRINVSGNYEPSNCRWATIIEQANNKTNNVMIEGMSLRRFCITHNLNYKYIDKIVNKIGIKKWYEEYLINMEKGERKSINHF